MKRSPMQRRTALRPRSERQVAYADELDEVRPLVDARCKRICEVCNYAAMVHLHHKLRRSQGGQNTMENLLGVCLACHELIHANPELSYERGWLVKRGK